MATVTTHQDLQLVTFLLDNQLYAVDVMSVREIISMTDITRTANSCHYFEGVINLRGTIVPVMSLRRRLGMADLDDYSLSCIAVMDFAGGLLGCTIDEVSDVMRTRRDAITPSPDAVEQPWIEGILKREQSLIVVLDLRHLFLIGQPQLETREDDLPMSLVTDY